MGDHDGAGYPHVPLLRVSIDDPAEAERVVSDLMGDQVEPRKEFIQKHARDVRFLDI